MNTQTLYRLVAKVNGDDIELLSEIQSVGFAGGIRQKLYEQHPELDHIVIRAYSKLINFKP